VIEPVSGDVAVNPGITREVSKAKHKEEPQGQGGGSCKEKEKPVSPHQFEELFHE
jgi:hypothetical protein